MTLPILGQRECRSACVFFIMRKTPRPDHVAVFSHLVVSDGRTSSLAAKNASFDAEEHRPPLAPIVNWDQRLEATEVDGASLTSKLGFVATPGPPQPVACGGIEVHSCAPLVAVLSTFDEEDASLVQEEDEAVHFASVITDWVRHTYRVAGEPWPLKFRPPFFTCVQGIWISFFL